MYHNPFPWGWRPLAYCVLPFFCLVYCVPPCFDLAYCVPCNNKTTIFGNFIYIKKIKWQYVACTCTIILANVNFGAFACTIFLVFDIPKSMFMLINAGNDPKKRERSQRTKVLDFLFLLCMWRLLWFLMKIKKIYKSFKLIKKLYITFLLIIMFNTVFRNLDQVHYF